MARVFKYRMLVQARTDLTEEEIRRYEASKGPNASSPSGWPYRDTGEIIHARRRRTAIAFYRALRRINLPIKIQAVRIPPISPKLGAAYKPDDVQLRAWRGFECLCGVVAYGGVEVGDQVKHVAANGCAFGGRTACGLEFTGHWILRGKPECDKCLAAAVEAHPEMKQYL